MSLASKLLSASGGVDKLWVDECFSSFTYTGNGSTQTINNGIDLAGKGGLVWIKGRSVASRHYLADTARGIAYKLSSNLTNAQVIDGTVGSLSSTGFGLSGAGTESPNESGQTFASWTFRKAPKFFDCLTYTGTGANRTIAHALGQEVGMIIVKGTSAVSNWFVYHRANTAQPETDYLLLNNTTGTADDTIWNDTLPTASVFTVGSSAAVNNSGDTYVAYLFAHDSSADGIVQCGSFTTDGSGNATVNLGWEPQYLMVKSSASVNGWWIFDTARGMPAAPATTPLVLQAQSTSSETSFGAQVAPNATGFAVTALGTSVTYVYLAIRRPNKPPSLGTQVYNAIARTGTGAAATVTGVGFAPDFGIVANKNRLWSGSNMFFDRLRGKEKVIDSTGTAAETTDTGSFTSFDMDGFSCSNGTVNANTYPYINWFFKRAPGVFDSSCDTGTGSIKSEAHNLKAIPELIIRKGRSGATQWEVYFAALGNTQKLVLNSTAATITDTTAWNSTTPTASNFTIGTGANVNTNAATYVTYLAASLAGISKVGTYVGNGTSQTINMGFTTGCRYFLVKASSTTGSWWVYDSVRGIVASADFALQLNSTAAEITSADCVDPASLGIVVNQEATCSINANGVTYQYWAYA